MNERMFAEVFPPGEFVKDELEARGWSQADLAEILGRSARLVSEIISGKRAVTAETARGLAEAFGTDAQTWLNLESAYSLWRMRPSSDVVRRRAKLYECLPIKEMHRRGWIGTTESIDVLEKHVMSFLGVSSLDDPSIRSAENLAHAARKTGYDERPSSAQIAWIYRVRHLASEMVTPAYSNKNLRDGISRLRALLTAPADARHAPSILRECGVRLVIVESLPGAKVDGVCLWLEDGTVPVVGMSLRFDRIDNFWFVLRHELEHVLRRDGVTAPLVDTELEGARTGSEGDLPPEEKAANAAASDFCVPKKEMDLWVKNNSPYFYEKELIGFAKRIGVHPGLVAGQLRNRTGDYRKFARHLEKIRSAVTAAAVVDGWGQTAPVSS